MTLWEPIDDTVHGTLQARILEWVAFPFSRGIFPTQGLNPGLPHCRQILYQLSHKGSPRILEWVDYPFSRGIIPTQESNRGLLHCRWILYQLNNIPQHKIKSLKFEEKRQICDNQNKMRLLRLILPKIHDGGSIYIYIQTLYSIFFFFFFMSYRKEGTGTRNIFLHILERFGDEFLPALY